MLVVNFATKEYRRAQQRLKNSLVGYKTLFFEDYQPGWPTHQQSPYAFKIYAIKEALKIDPVVLWADSSFYRVGDLSIIEKIIVDEGFFGEESGHYCWDWANDHCRNYHQLKKEEGLIMYSAGMTGINRDSPVAMEFLSQWDKSEKAGCFKGDYSNHRHDMVNASIIAQRLGLKFQKGGTYLSYIGNGYAPPNKTSIFYLQGL